MAKRSTVAGTAADPIAESVPLEIDGVTWRLRYDFNAIAEAEAATGQNLLLGMSVAIINAMTAATIRALLFAALRPLHPQATLLDAGALIRLDTLKEIQEALKETYLLAMPEKKRPEFREMIQAFQGLQTENSGSFSGPPPESSSDSQTANSIV